MRPDAGPCLMMVLIASHDHGIARPRVTATSLPRHCRVTATSLPRPTRRIPQASHVISVVLRIVLVTGGFTGFGAEMARAFDAEREKMHAESGSVEARPTSVYQMLPGAAGLRPDLKPRTLWNHPSCRMP